MSGELDDTAPQGAPVRLLRRYLRAHEWRQRIEGTRPRDLSPKASALVARLLSARGSGSRDYDLFVRAAPGFQEVELVIPKDQGSPQALRYVERALETLSAFERRPPKEIVGDIRAIGFDVVATRIPDVQVRDDAIRLDVATKYVSNMKALLAAIATTELAPAPYFLRIRKQASEYADRCRFGHTFRGSFGFTIESELEANDTPSFEGLQASPPFERRVVQRIARGVMAASEAAAKADPDILVSSSATAFNANACEHFASLVENTALSGLEFGFKFSPEWQLDPDVARSASFRIDARHVDVAREAAKALRAKPISRAETVFGRVVSLASQEDPRDLLAPAGAREVEVRWESEDLGEIKVEMVLGAEDYLRAWEAHGQGRPVKVAGTLERQGRRWVLLNPSSVTASGPSADPGG